ncbi:MAG: hypothetical protein ABI836_06035 [Gemmatimonadota bacterium]
MPQPRVPPFIIDSVAVAWEGAPHAVPLRHHTTLQFVPVPEWTAAGARHPVAVVGGSRPILHVVFRRTPGAGRVGGQVWRIGARSRGCPRPVSRNIRLSFDGRGLSGPHAFQLEDPLPPGPGKIRLRWHWHATADRRHQLSITRLQCYLPRSSPLLPADWAKQPELTPPKSGALPRRWVYEKVMKWSCQWTLGRTDDKAICDRLLRNLPRSGLQYAKQAWSVPDMLNIGGGYCGGMYRLFQALAGAQGVKVERRSYLVDWRVESPRESRWCAITVHDPGLNRKVPLEAASTFHDDDRSSRKRGPVVRRHVRRYRFWGQPGAMADGHCINFLFYRRRWYLYDASFRTLPVALMRFKLPPVSSRPLAVDGLGDFKSAYLANAVGHMLGTLEHNDRLYRTRHPDPEDPKFTSKESVNGLTVGTRLIPARQHDITFYWQD